MKKKKYIHYSPIEHEAAMMMNRRHFLSKLSLGLGGAALSTLLPGCTTSSNTIQTSASGILGAPHFAPKAKRVIYLFQSGSPSQIDLFDYKPLMANMHGEELPSSVRNGQRLTGMTAYQSSFPMVNSFFKFNQHGESGAWISELMPYTAEVADDLCFIKSMHTEAINHDPAITFFQTGSQQPGRPSIGLMGELWAG